MLFNRRRNDAEVRYNSRGIVDFILEDAESKKLTKDDDEMEKALAEEDADRPDDIVVDIIPTIYACATMWHETKNEMTQLMKSVFRSVEARGREGRDKGAYSGRWRGGGAGEEEGGGGGGDLGGRGRGRGRGEKDTAHEVCFQVDSGEGEGWE